MDSTTRRTILACASALLLAPPVALHAADAPKPNILLILRAVVLAREGVLRGAHYPMRGRRISAAGPCRIVVSRSNFIR
jgi:hypothetical protein